MTIQSDRSHSNCSRSDLFSKWNGFRSLLLLGSIKYVQCIPKHDPIFTHIYEWWKQTTSKTFAYSLCCGRSPWTHCFQAPVPLNWKKNKRRNESQHSKRMPALLTQQFGSDYVYLKNRRIFQFKYCVDFFLYWLNCITRFHDFRLFKEEQFPATKNFPNYAICQTQRQ